MRSVLGHIPLSPPELEGSEESSPFTGLYKSKLPAEFEPQHPLEVASGTLAVDEESQTVREQLFAEGQQLWLVLGVEDSEEFVERASRLVHESLFFSNDTRGHRVATEDLVIQYNLAAQAAGGVPLHVQIQAFEGDVLAGRLAQTSSSFRVLPTGDTLLVLNLALDLEAIDRASSDPFFPAHVETVLRHELFELRQVLSLALELYRGGVPMELALDVSLNTLSPGDPLRYAIDFGIAERALSQVENPDELSVRQRLQVLQNFLREGADERETLVQAINSLATVAERTYAETTNRFELNPTGRVLEGGQEFEYGWRVNGELHQPRTAILNDQALSALAVVNGEPYARRGSERLSRMVEELLMSYGLQNEVGVPAFGGAGIEEQPRILNFLYVKDGSEGDAESDVAAPPLPYLGEARQP